MNKILRIILALAVAVMPAAGQTVQVKSSSGTVTFRTAAQLRSDMGLAASGANTDITSLIAQGSLTANNANAAKIQLGGLPSDPVNYSGIWIGNVVPDTSNYTFLGTGSQAFINSTLETYFRIGNNTVFSVTGTGVILTNTLYPKVIAHPSVNQVLTSGGTVNTVAFGTEVIDTANAFAANTFTVPASAGGHYHISVSSLFLQTGGATSGVWVAIYVNGAAVARLQHEPLFSGYGYGLGGSTILPLNAGDVVTIRIQQSDGTAWTILGGIGALGRLTIHRIL